MLLIWRAKRRAQIQWLEHGLYEFEDLPGKIALFEVGSEGFAPLAPPLRKASKSSSRPKPGAWPKRPSVQASLTAWHLNLLNRAPQPPQPGTSTWIFQDGYESGDLSVWSSPPQPGTSTWIFQDGYESGDLSVWSSQ